ncbi:MAG: CDP-alcohol phosphatidyltransferase family protein [Bryobacteraceae bacterium]
MRSLPTILSLARAFVTPWVVLAVMRGDRAQALALCCAAGFTDFLDGFLARRFGWTSRVGAWTDAVADKVLLSTLYVAFGIAAWAPWWLVALVLGRDLLILAMAAIGLLFTPIRDFPPSIWGKVSTNVQIATALVVLLGPGTAGEAAISTFFGLCATMTAVSGFHYVVAAVQRFRRLPPSAD